MQHLPAFRVALSLALPAQIALIPVLLAAQDTPLVSPGQRVRVTTEWQGQHILIGRLVQWDPDSLRLELPQRAWNGIGDRPLEMVAIPSALVTQLDVHRGRTRNIGKGIARGALIGAGAGLVLGLVGGQDNNDFYQFGPQSVLGTMLFLGATGAGIGALAAPHQDLWQPVPLPPVSEHPEPIAQGTEP